MTQIKRPIIAGAKMDVPDSPPNITPHIINGIVVEIVKYGKTIIT